MDCQNNRRCSNCHGRHHFLVCFSRANKPQSRPKMLEFNQRNSFQSRPPAPVFKPRRPTQAHPIWERKIKPPMSNYNYAKKEEPVIQGPNENSVVSTVMNDQNKPKAYLMTKRLWVSARGSREEVPVYVFFDTGSQTSFVSKRLVERLNPPRSREIDQLEIHGFGGSLSDPLKINSPNYKMEIQREDGKWEEIVLNYTEEITTPFDMMNIDESKITRRSVANALEIVNEKPDIMIGIRFELDGQKGGLDVSQNWKIVTSKSYQ